MKTFKVVSILVAAWLSVALVFDLVMVYCHFANPELEKAIVKKIDKVIY